MEEYAARSEVVRFLTELRGLIDKRQRSLWARWETRQCMTDLELRDPDLWAVIRRLRVSEYHTGPEPDNSGREGEIWIFCPQVKGRHLYVKLWLNEGIVTCMSFKPAAPPLYCPYH